MKRLQILLGLVLCNAVPLLADAPPGPNIYIPLEWITFPGNENKVGMQLSLDGGNTFKLYQFDTGGAGLISSYTSNSTYNWWGNYTVVSPPEQGSITYDGGNLDLGIQAVTANVTIGNPSNPSQQITLNNFKFGQVTSASGSEAGDFMNRVNNGLAPWHDTVYGDFGAGLNQHEISSGHGLASMLGQLIGYSGFAIHLGTPGSPNPYLLLIGDGSSLLPSFPYATNMTLDSGTFPNTGLPNYQQAPVNVTYHVSDGIVSDRFDGVPTIMDTGGPTTSLNGTVHNSLQDDGYLKDGVHFSMEFANASGVGNFSIDFDAGGIQSVNQVSVDNGGDHTNAGLNPYAYYDIWYDLGAGVTRFGTLPAPVPEPATYQWLLAAGAMAMAAQWARRRKKKPGAQ